MPGKIKVKVLAGRNLPVMDRASDTTDAFVEIKFGSVTHKTDVCRKSLNPHWSSTEWYRFEVDESELQDEPLQLRLMDHDTYSANDAIGKVVISLAPLLAREAINAKNATGPSSGAVLSGWIPVFDTMHGIRGELNVIVKVELFTDFNKYKTSSCGVQFFHCATIPPGYKATAIHGFVEELVVNDDPEYQWIDKIRTPRASNEARQVAFIKLSNQVQRLVGVKAAELGANAVIGYQQDFDLEGEAGVVARAIGTAVSIIPPPSASQSISIPPCTQQQLRKCLDILATDNESITDLNEYFQNHQDELHKLLNILNPNTPALLDEPDVVEDDEKSILTRQSSIKSYTGSLSIYQDDYASQKSLRHLSEDQTDLNRLLKRNEDSDSDSTGPLQKMKKIKTTFLSKRFGSVRSRKSDKQEDSVSIKSNSSDTSRISLTDIKNEFKKFKRLKKPKFRKTFTNKQDEGIGMASILARSVIHAHTSLACIAETQDSEHSPSSTMRRTSESEPTINVSDDEKIKAFPSENQEHKVINESKVKAPEIHTSLKNICCNEAASRDDTSLQRKLSESCPATPMAERSDNLLKLPADASYYGSLSLSGDSSEVYTSSDEDDESSDQKTDTEKSVETTSSVVQSVLNHGVNPALIAQMDRKLSVLDGVSPMLKESKSHGNMEEHEQMNIGKLISLDASKSTPCIKDDENKCVFEDVKTELKSTSNVANEKSSKHNFKFCNPFTHKKVSKSISAPSSPIENKGLIYRSSKKIKQQISKISNSNMMKSLSHYSVIPKKRHSHPNTLSQPGSSSDVPSKVPSHETVLGSPFLSYTDLMSLDKETDSQKHCPGKNEEHLQSKVKMYIGSEPVSRASLSGSSSYYKEEGYGNDGHKSTKRDKNTLKPTGLVHTAMETILIDKVQSLLTPSSPDPLLSKEKQFFDDVHHKLELVEEARNKQQQLKTNPSLKLDSSTQDCDSNLQGEGSLQSNSDGKSIASTGNNTDTNNQDIVRGRERSRSPERTDKHESLLQTAMKTILIEKVQSLIPTTPESINVEETQNSLGTLQKSMKHDETVHSRRSSHHHHGGLLHTAMETILLDKVQALIPPNSEPVTPLEPIVPDMHASSENVKEKCKRDTAKLEAFEESQNPLRIHQKNRKHDDDTMHSRRSSHHHHGGLLDTAMETILLDKVRALIPPKSEPVTPLEPIVPDMHALAENVGEKYKHDTAQPDAIEDTQNPLSIHQKHINHDDDTLHSRRSSHHHHGGLLHTAMETILLDKVQALIPSKSEPVTPLEPIVPDMHASSENVREKYKHDTAKPDAMEYTQNRLSIYQKHINHDDGTLHSRRSSHQHHGSLLHTAMETILLDKVQALIPPKSEPVTPLEPIVPNMHASSENVREKYKHDTVQPGGIEDTQYPLSIHQKHVNHDDDTLHSRRSSHHHPSGLVQTAMKTILLDKVGALIPPNSEPVTPLETIVPDMHASSENTKEKDKDDTHSLLLTAMETMLLEKAETLIPAEAELVISEENDIFEPRSEGPLDDANNDFRTSFYSDKNIQYLESETLLSSKGMHAESSKNTENMEHSLFQTALKTILIDKAQSIIQTSTELEITNNEKNQGEIILQNEAKKGSLLDDTLKNVDTNSQQNLQLKSRLSILGNKKENKLVRQDSVHSLQDDGSQKMSKNASANFTCKVTHNKPVLQHFHPILSGSPLETIPSLPESSLDHTESLDVEGVDRTCDCQSECQCHVCDSETNSASVCDNSHAACRFDRNEGETEKCDKEKSSPRNLHARHESYGGREPVMSSQPLQNSSLNSTSAPVGIHRRSSDSDLSITPKGGSLNASVGNNGNGGGAILKPSMNTNNLEMLEYPFLTMTEYPPGFIVHIGGTVCARSVKLVDAGGESAARAAWWAELRTELRSHARALRCNAVIAYTESAAICEDVCVLSASGTAAVINLECDFSNDFDTLSSGWHEIRSLQRAASRDDRGSAYSFPGYRRPSSHWAGSRSKLAVDELEPDVCSVAHVPYSPGAGPYRAELSVCGGCRKARVPAVLLATCAKPSRLHSYAKAVTVTAVAARVRRAPPGSEPGARDISDQLPFLEYELHKLLLAKLRMQGANALFCLQTQISIGDRCVMALASGTAVRLATLPPATPPRIKASENDKDALDIQKALWDSFTANKTANGYDIAGSAEQICNGALPDYDIEEAPPTLDLCSDKDTCVLELDEAEDVETARSLATRRMHMQVFTSSLKPAPLSPPYAFAQVWRGRLVLSSAGGGASGAAERHVARALDVVTYKLRRLQPCALVAPKFQLELPEDEIQLVVSGAVIPLLDPNKPEHNLPELSPSVSPLPTHANGNCHHSNGTGDVDDDIFALDEEQLVKQPPPSEIAEDKNSVVNGPAPTMVSLTSLSYVNGSKSSRRICGLRLLFVRETTAVRELGGLSGFLHTFTCEVMAIVRSYTSALGGNALTSFYIRQLMLQDNAHKNQGQCLLSVGGDVVHITY